MADRRTWHCAEGYRVKQTTRETEFYCQASSSRSRAIPAETPRQIRAPAKKKENRVTKPQARKQPAIVKQLVKKVQSQDKKIEVLKKKVQKIQQKPKKATPVRKKKQPVIDRKIVIVDRYR